MRQLYIKQNVFSLSGKFSVKDAEENEVYFVEGSFMQVPKTFSILDDARNEVAKITKKIFSFLPTFFVDVQRSRNNDDQKGIFFFKSTLYN